MAKNVAVVGATGAVGTEMLRCLETRDFPVGELHLLASAASAGKAVRFKGQDVTLKALEGFDFAGPKILPHPYAFNFFSHNTPIDPDTGYNGEETKVMRETRKIMDLPDLRISITCVRVPVLRAHGIAMSVEFDQVVTPETAREVLAHAPGVRLVDDAVANRFPMPVEASGIEDVLVGRIRRDVSDPSGKTLSLFVCGDQLLKGAALNAVQIAERLA